MKWHFTPNSGMHMNVEITQRDDFVGESQNLASALVRESIQNSLDASSDEDLTIVKYRWVGKDQGLTESYGRTLFAAQLPHAKEAGLEVGSVPFDSPTALVIEDFGTSGLLGKVDENDGGDFDGFWRHHGKSFKRRKIGSAGLGKLVYAMVSEIGCYFGLTVREGDEFPLLMGQTVLNERVLQGKTYPAHAYWSDLSDDTVHIYEAMAVPNKTADALSEFCTQYDIDRQGQTGLSVVVPFPADEITPETLSNPAVTNYFYPLITGDLRLEIAEEIFDSQSVRALAKKYAANEFDDIDVEFDFIEAATNFSSDDLIMLSESWANDQKLDAADLSESDLQLVKDRFGRGELVGLRLPMTLKRASGDLVTTHFDVFIQRPEGIAFGKDLYVRKGITIPSEAKFKNSKKALGLLVAEHPVICELLADAENAAHTRWNQRTEKLTKNWSNPGPLIKAIKQSVIDLFDMLAEESEQADRASLASLFPAPPKRTEREEPEVDDDDHVTPDVDVDDYEPTPGKHRIARDKPNGGFRVLPPKDTSNLSLPYRVTVEVAYERVRKNPFSAYKPEDFNFSDDDEISVTVEGGCVIEKQGLNKLVATVSDHDFGIHCAGFDKKRDLKIRLTPGGAGND